MKKQTQANCRSCNTQAFRNYSVRLTYYYSTALFTSLLQIRLWQKMLLASIFLIQNLPSLSQHVCACVHACRDRFLSLFKHKIIQIYEQTRRSTDRHNYASVNEYAIDDGVWATERGKWDHLIVIKGTKTSPCLSLNNLEDNKLSSLEIGRQVNRPTEGKNMIGIFPTRVCCGTLLFVTGPPNCISPLTELNLLHTVDVTNSWYFWRQTHRSSIDIHL